MLDTSNGPFCHIWKKTKDCSSLACLCGFVNWHVWQLREKVHFMKYQLLHSSVSFLLDANSPRITWWHHSRRKWFALRHHHCCCGWCRTTTWSYWWWRVKRCNSLTKFFKVDPLIREKFLGMTWHSGGRKRWDLESEIQKKKVEILIMSWTAQWFILSTYLLWSFCSMLQFSHLLLN